MKISYKSLLMAGFASLALTAASSTANASLLNGLFNFEIYQADINSGNINAASQQAELGNPLINVGNLIATSTYQGDFDLYAAGAAVNNNIGYFLTHAFGGATNGGIVNYVLDGSAAALSSANFDLTTVIKWTFAGDAFEYLGSSITHDDGVSIYDSTLASILLAPLPVSPTTSGFFSYGGAWTMIYVAANDLPEVLSFQYESAR